MLIQFGVSIFQIGIDMKITKLHMLRKKIRGGAALTLSHEIDLMSFSFFGDIQKVKILKSYKSKLKLNTDLVPHI